MSHDKELTVEKLRGYMKNDVAMAGYSVVPTPEHRRVVAFLLEKIDELIPASLDVGASFNALRHDHDVYKNRCEELQAGTKLLSEELKAAKDLGRRFGVKMIVELDGFGGGGFVKIDDHWHRFGNEVMPQEVYGLLKIVENQERARPRKVTPAAQWHEFCEYLEPSKINSYLINSNAVMIEEPGPWAHYKGGKINARIEMTGKDGCNWLVEVTQRG